MQKIILVDNGSRRAEAVLNLKRLAGQMSENSCKTIEALPLQHAHKIPPEEFGDALGGKPVATFAQYVEDALISGVDELVIIPMFFGKSRAITSFIPDTLNALRKLMGNSTGQWPMSCARYPKVSHSWPDCCVITCEHWSIRR